MPVAKARQLTSFRRQVLIKFVTQVGCLFEPGIITDLAFIELSGTFTGMGAFDPCTGRIHFLTPDGMRTADGASGAVISLVPLPVGESNFANIEAVW